jgi:hypothetical protein
MSDDEAPRTEPTSMLAIGRRLDQLEAAIRMLSALVESHARSLEQLATEHATVLKPIHDMRNYLQMLTESFDRLSDSYQQLTEEKRGADADHHGRK